MSNKIFRKSIIKKIIDKLLQILILPIASKLLYRLPISKEKIIFDNFGGKGFGGNPKYIAEQILKENLKWDLVWLVENPDSHKFPQGVRAVEINSIKGIYERATAQVWIDNVRHLHPVKKKKNQIYLQTWHAPFSPKCVEKDAEHQLSKKYTKEAKYDGKITDGIIVNSKLQEEQFLRAFWLGSSAEILRFGLPRNDFLVKSFNDNKKVSNQLREKLGIDKDKYVILYAPTFRDDYSTDGYKIEFCRILDAFTKQTQRDCIIIIRLHPNVQNQSSFIKYSDDIIDGTTYPDIQELVLISDSVISDYSTTLFDFALLYKPAYICALDLEDYRKKRGLLKEFEQLPFPCALTNDQLVENITMFKYEEYKNGLEQFFNQYPIYDIGNSSEMSVQWLKKKMKLGD